VLERPTARIFIPTRFAINVHLDLPYTINNPTAVITNSAAITSNNPVPADCPTAVTFVSIAVVSFTVDEGAEPYVSVIVTDERFTIANPIPITIINTIATAKINFETVITLNQLHNHINICIKMYPTVIGIINGILYVINRLLTSE
jgi:hypothetical protein